MRIFFMRGYVNNSNDKIYYVYAWYFIDTNEIFHIGKGKNNRYLDAHNHRNTYFLSIVEKYPTNVASKILISNLTNDEACKKERELILQYKKLGQCKTNFHEGGCGGYTGKYDSPERSRKLSIAAQKRTGNKNSMYGKHHTEKTKQKLSKIHKGKKLTAEHIEKLRAANTGRKKTQKELDAISKRFKGIPKSLTSYNKMMNKICPYHYFVELNNKVIFDSISSTKLEDFCENTLHISRSIISSCILGIWTPKFKKHMHLQTLKIYKVARNVNNK